jgi:putative ABC transport system permease protein
VLRITVDPMVLAIGLGSALLMGMIGGLLPAISAMRLRPLESVR